jgi:hypothetical protein
VLAEPLAPGETAVAAVGPVALEKGFKRAAQHAFLTSVRPLDAAAVGAITQSA